MFTFIEGLPDDVLAIEASGKITHQDYRDVLIPRAEALMAKGPAKMLYVLGHDLTGFELEALWDDTAFGVKHWRAFSRIAVVSDQPWIRACVSMFAPLFPAEIRMFGLSDMSTAKTWISGAGDAPSS